ncbi:hypothetical protein HYH02_008244 [Chlamydomonas schloesseri]|uniref:Proline dehydrogenase n=1 Tax=Chlamydomonas schloesseri TaxID=2026947 RepID=A0A836B3K1_9CHLO|nr:hypothetical protein HYH02_008244 [Chlamydomonas schloesseri]|eukprot:KAG2446676.1 hypothetical protein HYH02_008244 [Chlamydomonas schloesseri]
MAVLRLCASPALVQSAENILEKAPAPSPTSSSMASAGSMSVENIAMTTPAPTAGMPPGMGMGIPDADAIGAMLHQQFVVGNNLDEPSNALPTFASMPLSGRNMSMKDIANMSQMLAFAAANHPAITTVATLDGDVMARTAAFSEFELETETVLERTCVEMLAEIDEAASSSGQGFATVKVASLGDPRLLKHLSKAMGITGQLAGALTAGEQKHLDALVGRLEWLVSRAQRQGVKLIIAAERASLRPAVDAIARELMRQYNKPGNTAHGSDANGGQTHGAVIFTTYQAYMRDAQARLAMDLAMAEKDGYRLGAKLVGGADPHQEAISAARKGHKTPVWGTSAETDVCFNGCVAQLAIAVSRGAAEIMIASHSYDAVTSAAQFMLQLGLCPEKAPVYFNVDTTWSLVTQDTDDLSVTLGQQGYKVFKYTKGGNMVPYEIKKRAAAAAAAAAAADAHGALNGSGASAPVPAAGKVAGDASGRPDLSKLQESLLKRLAPNNDDPVAQAAAQVAALLGEHMTVEELPFKGRTAPNNGSANSAAPAAASGASASKPSQA